MTATLISRMDHSHYSYKIPVSNWRSSIAASVGVSWLIWEKVTEVLREFLMLRRHWPSDIQNAFSLCIKLPDLLLVIASKWIVLLSIYWCWRFLMKKDSTWSVFSVSGPKLHQHPLAAFQKCFQNLFRSQLFNPFQETDSWLTRVSVKKWWIRFISRIVTCKLLFVNLYL